MSSVSELIPVGGQKLPEGKELLESPDVSSMSQMISVGGGLSEQKAKERNLLKVQSSWRFLKENNSREVLKGN